MCSYFIYILVSNYNINHSKQASNLGGLMGLLAISLSGAHQRGEEVVRHGFRLTRIKKRLSDPHKGAIGQKCSQTKCQ